MSTNAPAVAVYGRELIVLRGVRVGVYWRREETRMKEYIHVCGYVDLQDRMLLEFATEDEDTAEQWCHEEHDRTFVQREYVTVEVK